MSKHIAVYLLILRIDVYTVLWYNISIEKNRTENIMEKNSPKYYDEKAKDRTMKYMKEKRDKLTLNLPLGDKERYQNHAKQRGKSLTKLITELLEEDITLLKAAESLEEVGRRDPEDGLLILPADWDDGDDE